MNHRMLRPDYEALPYRDDVVGGYERGAYYRARGDDRGVYQWVGTAGWPRWWSFTVEWVE